MDRETPKAGLILGHFFKDWVGGILWIEDEMKGLFEVEQEWCCETLVFLYNRGKYLKQSTHPGEYENHGEKNLPDRLHWKRAFGECYKQSAGGKFHCEKALRNEGWGSNAIGPCFFVKKGWYWRGWRCWGIERCRIRFGSVMTSAKPSTGWYGFWLMSAGWEMLWVMAGCANALKQLVCTV